MLLEKVTAGGAFKYVTVVTSVSVLPRASRASTATSKVVVPSRSAGGRDA
jgi:hypothetical protein